MLLESCFAVLPSCTGEWYLYLSGILGALLLIYSQFVQADHRRDIVRMLGAGGLFVYAFYISNMIFMIASGGVFVAALIEYIEIMTGTYTYATKEFKQSVKEYKKAAKK